LVGAVGGVAEWHAVPKDDLVAYEAFEYAIKAVNRMRAHCSHMALAPLATVDFSVVKADVRSDDLHTTYRLAISGTDAKGIRFEVLIAQQKAAMDLSVFTLNHVMPEPCALSSEIDDANLEIGYDSDFAEKAKEVVMVMLNKERAILCPDRPELQFLTIIAASVQVVQGVYVRLVLELREATQTFADNAFQETIAVVYTLDRDVPGLTTTSPVIYPSRTPCELEYVHPHSATDIQKTESQKAEAERRLSPVESPPRASGVLADAQSKYVVRPRLREFNNENVDTPADFDPRIARTLCFPRGLTRPQGSCGSGWAFAATSAASFRYCLHNLHNTDFHSGLKFFSAQELVSCAAVNGCAGGNAAEAFLYLKRHGLPFEECSRYRMRCFVDTSLTSTESADFRAAVGRSASCPRTVTPSSPCKCLPRAWHPAAPVDCDLLPISCDVVKVPHYFFIPGIDDGATLDEFEANVMQEITKLGPLYASLLLYEDFYDPVCWTESGIYTHREGLLIGKHAVTLLGWGTDGEGREYWLLFNSFGNHWQDEGYFKVLRGETTLSLPRFGAYGVDFSSPALDDSAPLLSELEVSFAPEFESESSATSTIALKRLPIRVQVGVSEPAQVLLRAVGEANSASLEARSTTYTTEQVVEVDLLERAIVSQRVKLILWAVDHAQNSASLGTFSVYVTSPEEFSAERMRAAGALDSMSLSQQLPFKALIENAPQDVSGEDVRRLIACPDSRPNARVASSCPGILRVEDGARTSAAPRRVEHPLSRSGGVVSVGQCDGGRMTLLCRADPPAHAVPVGHSQDLRIQKKTVIQVTTPEASTAVDLQLDGKFKAVLLGRDGAVPDRYNFEASSPLTVSRCSDRASMLLPHAGTWYVVVMFLPSSPECDEPALPVRGVVSVEASTSPVVEPVLQLWELPRLLPPQRDSWTALPPGLIALDGPVEVEGCGAVFWTASAWEPASWLDLNAAPGGTRRLIDATYLASKGDCATRIRAARPGVGISAAAAGPLALLLWTYLWWQRGRARPQGPAYAVAAQEEPSEELEFRDVLERGKRAAVP
jgi:hypothetical protein